MKHFVELRILIESIADLKPKNGTPRSVETFLRYARKGPELGTGTIRRGIGRAIRIAEKPVPE